MVDATFSISAPRPQAAAVRAAPFAAPFAAALPASAAVSTAALPAVPSSASPPGPGLAGATPATTAGPAGSAPSFAPAPAVAASAGVSGSVVPAVASAAAPKAAAATPSAFHVLLSELNPLQYVPVVGTIYRAVTGDTIPEAARFAGGLVVSGLTGGPVGIAMNLGATLIEHLAGIDPERIGDRLLAELGIGHAGPAHAAPTALASAAPPATAAAPAPAAAQALASSAPASSARAWSPAQLAAYGVTGGTDGTLRRGTVSGADVLNSLELARIAAPAAAA